MDRKGQDNITEIERQRQRKGGKIDKKVCCEIIGDNNLRD